MKKRKKKKSWKKRKEDWEKWELKKKLRMPSFIPNAPKSIPFDAVAADVNILAANNNTYGTLPPYYKDSTFICRDCGTTEVWTAAQQKWWYEVIKANINSIAVRCQACRAKIRAEKVLQKKHMAEMAKRIPHPNEAFFRKRHFK